MPWRTEPVQRVADARRAIHWALTFVLAWFGFTLARPDDTFSASYSFSIMAQAMTETHWASVFFVMAAVGVLGLSNRQSWVIRLSTFVLSTGHGVIAFCFALGGIGHPLLPGAGAYMVFAVLGYYLTWRYR